MAVLEQVLEHTLSLCILIPFLYLTGYVLYQRHIHRLAKYPGPFLASLTDLWQVMQFLSLKQPYNLTALHEKYGSVVRYGPDKLSITNESAIPLIYTKGARLMPKTEYYDAFGAAHPNVFGMRDEDVSARLSGELAVLTKLDALIKATAHGSQLFHLLRQTDGGLA